MLCLLPFHLTPIYVTSDFTVNKIYRKIIRTEIEISHKQHIRNIDTCEMDSHKGSNFLSL